MQRGDDWDGGNADGLVGGSGLGTVVRVDRKSGVVAVKWESGNYGFYKMGVGGKYEVKIATIKKTEPFSLEENKDILESESEYELESDEDENVVTNKEVNNIVFATEQQCEVCGSLWTEKVKDGDNIIFRCIKHRKKNKPSKILKLI